MSHEVKLNTVIYTLLFIKYIHMQFIQFSKTACNVPYTFNYLEPKHIVACLMEFYRMLRSDPFAFSLKLFLNSTVLGKEMLAKYWHFSGDIFHSIFV